MPVFDVPFSSQYSDLGDHEWRARGCGIASLKMVMDYWHVQDARNQTPTLDELLERSLTMGAHTPTIGWSHAGLVKVAHHYGYKGFAVDVALQSPTPKNLPQAWEMLCSELKQSPVLVSVFSGLDPNRGGGHIVVLAGVRDEIVLLNDPQELHAREGRKVLALNIFLSAFKQRYIVIRPA